ncbi:MAG: hypothetical protein V1899_06035 [Planctomycetota bacterium]
MTKINDKLDLADAELLRASEAVAGLPQPEPPRDLVSRTVARVVKDVYSFKKVFWLLRPITNPVARLVAAALIIVILTPMTDLNMADSLGARIEQRILGRRVIDRFEILVDRVLVIRGPSYYSQDELDAFMGVQRLPMPRRLRNFQSARKHQT